jgi:hypothetical protein
MRFAVAAGLAILAVAAASAAAGAPAAPAAPAAPRSATFPASASASTAPAFPADAAAILARAKEATGGSRWDAIRSRLTRGALHTGGLDGTVESLSDVVSGRYVDRYALGPVHGGEGFDGRTVWTQDASGQARAEEASEARTGTANEAYRRSLAFWYPQRWPAAIEVLGRRTDAGRQLDVLRISPRDGRPFELWVDAASGLFDRVIETGGTETLTTRLSDYRAVDGLKVPFAVRTGNGTERYDQRISVESVTFNTPVEAAAFAVPAPPPADFSVGAGASSVTVPFELLNNHLYVEVKLNGKGPFKLILDTGGANVITPDTARALGVKAEGKIEGHGVGEQSADVAFAKLGSIELGGITLRDQLFAVFDLGSLAAAEGMPQQGIIGYEVFKRFVVRVDYEHRTLTLTLPSAFAYHGTGVVVPFKFNDHVPEVEGAIDGIAGTFDIDTGSRASLDLLGPFVEEHGLRAHYAPKLEGVSGWGLGGAARAQFARAESLRLGGLEIPHPVIELTRQTKGAFSNKFVAGNVGGALLRRFNVTFDYSRQQIIFEPHAGAASAGSFDRAGVWMHLAAAGPGGPAAFEAIDVYAGGPAAEAGLRAGDRILQVDGRGPGDLTLAALRERLRDAPVGTRVHLLIERGGERRELVVVVRDLV